MRMRLPVCAAFTFIFTFTVSCISHAAPTQGYVDKNLEPLSEYSSILDDLSNEFGDSTPKLVKLEIIDTNGSSSFDPYANPKTIFISRRWFNEGDKKRIVTAIAHETAHLAIFNMTLNGQEHGASIYNEFRFIDEGLAELVGRKFGGFNPPKWDQVKAAKQSGKVDLAQIANWLNEPPYVGAPGTFNVNLPAFYKYDFSYAVGASFILYLESIQGFAGVMKFLRSLGVSRQLDVSIREVYQLSLKDAEIGWMTFIEKL